jgi:hypothetical protein
MLFPSDWYVGQVIENIAERFGYELGPGERFVLLVGPPKKLQELSPSLKVWESVRPGTHVWFDVIEYGATKVRDAGPS